MRGEEAGWRFAQPAAHEPSPASAKPPISPERARELFDYDPDTGILRWKPRAEESFKTPQNSRSWNARYAGRVAGSEWRGYTRVKFDGFDYSAHRVAWVIATGRLPLFGLDHINGDRRDNRLCNLRDVSPALNSRNRSKISGKDRPHPCIRRQCKRWHVRIGSFRKNDVYLGYFDSLDAAIEARNAEWVRRGYGPNHWAAHA